MDLTTRELQKVAISRYWKGKSKSILLGLLVIVNIIGLGLLGLYLTGNFPVKEDPLEYSLNGFSVTVTSKAVLLNGQEMQLVERERERNYMVVFYGISLVLLLGYALHHLRRAQVFGGDLLEESISKEKSSGG